jgi:hypothetical protein
MRGSWIEKEAEICVTNLANKRNCMSCNAESYTPSSESFRIYLRLENLPIAGHPQFVLGFPDRHHKPTLTGNDRLRAVG